MAVFQGKLLNGFKKPGELRLQTALKESKEVWLLKGRNLAESGSLMFNIISSGCHASGQRLYRRHHQ